MDGDKNAKMEQMKELTAIRSVYKENNHNNKCTV